MSNPQHPHVRQQPLPRARRRGTHQFLDFFQSTPEIAQMFADAGVQVEPHPVFWEKVDTAGTF
jgi:hypothetical protein